MLKNQIANFITVLRIILTLCLLFISPLTTPFYVVYSLSGVTDVLDGTVARMTKTAGKFGATLDSIADLFFYSVMILKVFPVLLAKLPKVFWIFVATVLLIRLSAYIAAAVKYKCFASMHTYLNKLTGLLVFAIPYFINLSFFTVYAVIACIVGATASAEELIIYLKGNYVASKK